MPKPICCCRPCHGSYCSSPSTCLCTAFGLSTATHSAASIIRGFFFSLPLLLLLLLLLLFSFKSKLSPVPSQCLHGLCHVKRRKWKTSRHRWWI